MAAATDTAGPKAPAAGPAAYEVTNKVRLLVLSATEFETAPLRAGLADATTLPGWPPTVAGTLGDVPVLLVAGGIGKANAAAAVARRRRLAGVLQVGIGGTYPGAALELGAAVVARSEFDLDLGVGRRPAWTGLEAIGIAAFAATGGTELNRLELDHDLANKLAVACGLVTAAFATSDSVTGDLELASVLAEQHGVGVESMEGVAAAQVAAALGLPFAELRGMSNVVGERDKRRWQLHGAVTAACAAAAVAAGVMWGHITRVARESR